MVVAPVATSSGLLVTSALTWQVEERETYDRDQEVAGECVVSDVVAPDAAVGGCAKAAGRNAWPEPSRCPGFESGYGKDVSELWPRR